MSWHLICKSGRGAHLHFVTPSPSLIHLSCLLLLLLLLDVFALLFTHAEWRWHLWIRLGLEREQRKGRKKRRWMLLNVGQSLRFFLIYLHAFIFFVCASPGQQNELKIVSLANQCCWFTQHCSSKGFSYLSIDTLRVISSIICRLILTSSEPRIFKGKPVVFKDLR